MGRMTVTVEEELVRRAQRALGTRSKAETIRLALREVLRRERLVGALAHQGKVDLALDQETLRKLRADR